MNVQTLDRRHTAAALLFLATGLLLVLGCDRAAAAPGRWGADYFPNIALTNQDGETRHFYDDVIKGKVVAINFIYTSCEDSCPVETAKMRNIQKLLGDRVGKDVYLYSISIDPARDTPEVLKHYAEKFSAGPGWEFLTGNEEEVKALRIKLGMLRNEGEEDLEEHVVSLIVGNESTGQWMKRSSYDSPRVLATVLGSQLHNFRTDPKNRVSYAQARPRENFTRGEYLFRTRCGTCHTVGNGDLIGPDLRGVTERREESWLKRWIKEPDKMLAEKDPIATELFHQYRELPMPNVRLQDSDAEALIEYLRKRSEVMTTAQDHHEHEHDDSAH